MDSISELLSSVSPEELERLKGVAQNLLSQNKENASDAPPKKESGDGALGGISSLFGRDTAKMIATVAKALNQDDDRTKFIAALKPLLSEERQKRADEAMRFLRLMDALPLLKGLF